MKYYIPLLLVLIFSSTCSALDFGRLGGTFTMDGEILEGDTVNLLIELSKWEVPPTVFHITSPGGDLGEAMLIGEIIRESQIPVWSGDECSSACVFILASGVERSVFGKLGLHRPYFDKSYFANLTSTQAKDKYEELKEASIDYLKKMEVKQSIIERIFETDSTNVELLEKDEANKLFGYQSQFYEEWLTAKCGKFTPEQTKIIKSYWSLVAALQTYQVMNDPSIPKTEDFGSNLDELMENGKLAYELQKANLLQPYIELSENHKKCTEKAVSRHVYSWHKVLKKFLTTE